MTYSFYCGLDLGQRSDYTALCIVEESAWLPEWLAEGRPWLYRAGLGELAGLEPGWVSPARISPTVLHELAAINYHEGQPPDAPLSVRHLQRFALNTPYGTIVEAVRDMLAAPPLVDRPTALVADATGVGVAVTDMLVQAGLRPVSVHIHGGDRVARGPDGTLRTPKRDLVSATQVALQIGRLRISKQLPEAATLRKELTNFRITINPATSHDSYAAWREQDHDDLLLAVALAVWYRGWYNHHIDVDNATALRR